MSETRELALTRLWHNVHTRLLMLAQGQTTSYDSSGSAHQKPGSKKPPAIDREVMKLEQQWRDCQSDSDRHDTVMAALNLLGLYGVKKNPLAKRGTEEWREAIARDPRPSRVVAKMYGVGHDTVCRYRKQLLKREKVAA